MKTVRLLAIVIATLLCSGLASAQIASNPYIHYDPSIASSVTILTNTPATGNHVSNAVYVAQIDDLSGNGFHAVDADISGHTEGTYPGLEFDTGIFGLDLGGPGNGTAMDILTPAQQDALFNFGGGASTNSGFSIFLVLEADAEAHPSPFLQSLLSNGPFPNNQSAFGLYRGAGADNTLYLALGIANVVIPGDNPPLTLPDGARAVIALTYDEINGDYRLEIAGGTDNDGFIEVTNDLTLPFPGNYVGSQDLALGASPVWANFYMNCNHGETLFYNRYIDPTTAEYTNTLDALATKWNIEQAPPPPPLEWTVTGDSITFEWFVDLSLVSQTNPLGVGLDDSWVGIPSGDVSPLTVDIDPSLDTVFYALGTNIYVPGGTNSLYAQYDASVVSSVILDAGTNTVAQWEDVSGSGFVAPQSDLNNFVEAVYPGDTFASGLAGIEVGLAATNRGTSFNLLSPNDQEGLLNFGGAAAGNDGFSVLMALRIDAEIASGFQSILANGTFPNNSGGIGIYRDNSGVIHYQLDGASELNVVAGSMAVGDEAILFLTYDAISNATHVATFNSSTNGTGSFTTNAVGVTTDFTAARPLRFGSSAFSNFFIDGDLGEVKLYRKYIDPLTAEYTNIINTASNKWLAP